MNNEMQLDISSSPVALKNHLSVLCLCVRMINWTNVATKTLKVKLIDEKHIPLREDNSCPEWTLELSFDINASHSLPHRDTHISIPAQLPDLKIAVRGERGRQKKGGK